MESLPHVDRPDVDALPERFSRLVRRAGVDPRTIPTFILEDLVGDFEAVGDLRSDDEHVYGLRSALTREWHFDASGYDAAAQIAGAKRLDALAFAHLHADQLRDRYCYVVGRGWHHREPLRIWRPDTEALKLRRYLSTGLVGMSKARGVRTRDVVTELEALLTRPGAWDTDPELCGLPDGRIFDLARGYARDATADDLTTRRLGAHPRDSAECPRWLELVNHIAGGDEERDWLQAWAGYTLTGYTREHAFVFLTGPGGAGKSTFVETVRRALGSYAAGIPEDIFVGGANRHREWLARLAGARLAAIPDLPAGGWSNMGILKSLVSAEAQTANFMRRASFDFTPACKLWLTGNAKPRLGRSDSGFARRLVLIPVTRAPRPDRHLPEALTAELPGITAWITEGATTYLTDGLPPIPARWQAAATDYQHAEDTIGAWFNERCQLDADAFTPGRALVADYNEHTGARLGRATALYEWIAERPELGITRTRARHDDAQNPTEGVRGVSLCRCAVPPVTTPHAGAHARTRRVTAERPTQRHNDTSPAMAPPNEEG